VTVTSQSFTFPENRQRIIRRQSRILATATYFPERVLSNQEIIDAHGLPVTDLAIRKTLGVERRRVASEGTVDSDLLAEAARRCLASANLHPDQLSKILVTKFLGDTILPMTAALVQRKLGCRVSMHAVDIEGGISAFLHAVDLATRYISTTREDQQYILILAGGLHRLAVSKTDPRVAFLFGDGAAALLLTVAPEPHFLGSYLYSNYEYFSAAGTRRLTMDRNISERLYERGEHELLYDLYTMDNWKESADFFLQAAEVTRDRLLEQSGLTMDAVRLVLVTENNKRLRDMTLERLGVHEDRSMSVIHEYGNTMSAMLPNLLHAAIDQGRVTTGDHILLLSHGEGASGGGILYRM
jgi:3-oxoacyl-[acyl-carrier-protein] synthase-3